MDISSAKIAITDSFNTAWANRYPVDYDNDDFNEPENSIWARMVIRSQPSAQSSLGIIGNRRFDRNGIMFLQLFAPVETGTNALDIISEEMRVVFEGVTIDGIWFFETDVSENGEDGKYFNYLLQSTFNYVQIK